MWGRVTLGLIGALALTITLLILTKSVKVTVQLPVNAGGGGTASPVFLAVWMFILGAAVIIVAVTAVRLIVKLAQRLSRR